MLELSVSWSNIFVKVYINDQNIYTTSSEERKVYIVEQQPKNHNSFKSFNRVN